MTPKKIKQIIEDNPSTKWQGFVIFAAEAALPLIENAAVRQAATQLLALTKAFQLGLISIRVLSTEVEEFWEKSAASAAAAAAKKAKDVKVELSIVREFDRYYEEVKNETHPKN